MKIIVDSLKEKLLIIGESEYIHYLDCNDTDKSCILSHIYLDSKFLKLNTNNPLEIFLNNMFDDLYINYDIGIKVDEDIYPTEYSIFLNSNKNKTMVLNSDITINSMEENEELRTMIIDWLNNEIPESNSLMKK